MDPPSSFQHQHSPFLSDLDGPTRGNDPTSSSPFTSFTDFNTSAAFEDSLSVAANASVPATPYTPSFAAQVGSYHNSPLGSDLGNEFPQHSPNPNAYTTGTEGDHFGDIDISVFPPDYPVDDYDPSAYDAPDNSTLLFGSDFMASLNEQTNAQSQNRSQNQSSSPSLSTSSLGSNNPGVSVSVTPALDDPMGAYGSGSSYDHGSPSSSNGDNDYNRHQQQNDVARSRGSSISSQPNDYQGSATYGMEGVHLDASPSLNRVHSPSWASKSQVQGAHSPPQIYIPGQTPEITHTATSPLPSPTPSKPPLPANNGNSILPPGGIGMNVNIVPATPISAGVAHGVPFHMNMMNQERTSPSNSQTQSWGGHTNQQQQYNSPSRGTSPLPRLPQAPPSQYTFPPNAALTPPPSGGSTSLSLGGNGGDAGNALSALQLSRDGSPERVHGSTNGSGNFLVPISNPRIRSKSETAIRPQMWQMNVGMGASYDAQDHLQNQNQNQDAGHGSMLQTGDDSFGHQQQSQVPRLNTPHMPASFGPPISSVGFDGDNMPNTGSAYMSNNFLSPDHALGGAADLRRSRSDSQGHRRNALSADMTPIFADRSLGAGGAGLFYPSPGFPNRQGGSFLSSGQTGGVGFSGGLGMVSAGGAHRRSVSHGGSGHGHSRSLSRDRVSLHTSPYPSPHASPRVISDELLPDTYSFPPGSPGYGTGAGTSSSFDGTTPTVHVMSHDEQGRPTVQSQAPIQVVRQNVTTHATADASQRRRRTEANFVCPVPGCGSTFTRHFNLKGHLRSHNEERPFKCKWPGCDKGFARQHDCKRHEQLHLNIRPYTCNGCKRTFARMDALNRHLRSDAGTECQAQQPILTSETPNNPAAIAVGIGSQNNSVNEMTSGMLTLKNEPDANWQPSAPTGGVMV